MSAHSEALRLADLLEPCCLTIGDAQQAVAAAELRRLHAERTAADGVINDLAAKVRGLQTQRDALLEVVQKYFAWSEAEHDHKGTTFWERVEMCREVDELARAAIKAAEES